MPPTATFSPMRLGFELNLRSRITRLFRIRRSISSRRRRRRCCARKSILVSVILVGITGHQETAVRCAVLDRRCRYPARLCGGADPQQAVLAGNPWSVQAQQPDQWIAGLFYLHEKAATIRSMSVPASCSQARRSIAAIRSAATTPVLCGLCAGIRAADGELQHHRGRTLHRRS